MKKKITLLPFFVILFSSLTMLKAQPPAGLTQDQWNVLRASTAHASRAIEEEKTPLGKLLTEVAHKDVRPLIIEYVAAAPTFIKAVRNIAGLAGTNKALREESIKALNDRIKQGATANQKDIKSHATDLLFEVVKSEKPIPLIAVEALIGTGADVNAKGQHGNTPLHMAAFNGYTQIVNTLIGANADVNAKDQHGYTPLLWAAQVGHTPIVTALIGANADVNAKNQYGETPLHWAAREGNTQIVDALIKAKADKTIKNNQGKTAYDVTTDPKIKRLLE